jgi:ATP-dependent Clp protease ATP-binding subunit ClpC
MTSNLGTADLRKTSVGFAKADEAVTHEKMSLKVNEALKQHFRPEFLNRHRRRDRVPRAEARTRSPRSSTSMLRKGCASQLESQGLSVELTRAAKYLVVEKRLRRRPWAPGRLRRALQRMVEDPLSEKILSKEYRAGDTIIVDAENGEITFRAMEHIEPPPAQLAGALSSD